MCPPGSDLFLTGRLNNAHSAVRAASDDALPALRVAKSFDPSLTTRSALQLLTIRSPRVDCAIAIPGGQEAAVGREGDRPRLGNGAFESHFKVCNVRIPQELFAKARDRIV